MIFFFSRSFSIYVAVYPDTNNMYKVLFSVFNEIIYYMYTHTRRKYLLTNFSSRVFNIKIHLMKNTVIVKHKTDWIARSLRTIVLIAMSSTTAT